MYKNVHRTSYDLTRCSGCVAYITSEDDTCRHFKLNIMYINFSTLITFICKPSQSRAITIVASVQLCVFHIKTLSRFFVLLLVLSQNSGVRSRMILDDNVQVILRKVNVSYFFLQKYILEEMLRWFIVVYSKEFSKVIHKS